MVGEQQPGTVGSGKFDGFYWDGRKWRSLEDGSVGRFDPWQRTHWAWRVFFVALAAGVALYLGIQFS